MPPVAIFAIALIVAVLTLSQKPSEKKTSPPTPNPDDDAGDLIAKALEKYLQEKKKKP